MNTKITDGTRTLQAVLCAAILSSCVGWATEAVAAKSFFCKATIAADADHGPVSITGPLVYDMGILGSCTDLQYGGPQFNEKCTVPARRLCSDKAQADGNFNSAAFWCAKKVPDGSTIRAYAATGGPEQPLGKSRYAAVQTKGVLINKAAVTATTCTCPKGWIGDNNVDGGVTTNQGKCARVACPPIMHAPYPPNDTKIGTGSPLPWGFSWGNTFYQFGSSANGGAPKCETHIVSPAVCRWQ